MKHYLIKNTTADNLAASVKVNPSESLEYTGVESATLVDGDELITCLSPLSAEIKKIDDSRTECIDLGAGDLFAVEIDGVVYTYYFKPWQLVKFFNGSEDVDLVKIGFCSDYDE